MSAAVVILQARFSSTRLPGKALATVGARSILAHCLARLRLANVGPVVLATTERPEDDALVRAASFYNVRTFRGPEHDVLSRFALVARETRASVVIRATGDNPAVDIDAPRRSLAALQALGVDHVVESNLPYGAAVEALTVDALFKAAALATAPDDREHVTTLIRRDRTLFSAISVEAPRHLRRPDIRVTVDTPQDLLFMQRVADELGGWHGEPPLSDLIAAADLWQAGARCA
jgi:spore coat polysaccharide biosynthesis protein SpsF